MLLSFRTSLFVGLLALASGAFAKSQGFDSRRDFLSDVESIMIDGKPLLPSGLVLDNCFLRYDGQTTQLSLVDLSADYPIAAEGPDQRKGVYFPLARVHVWRQATKGARKALAVWQAASQSCWLARRQESREWARGLAEVSREVPSQVASASLPVGPVAEHLGAAFLAKGFDSLRLRLELIRNARESIFYKTFEFSGDESGRLIAEALIKRKIADQVDVQVFVDAFAVWTEAGVYQASNSVNMLGNLMAAGIPVAGYACNGRNPLIKEAFEDQRGVAHLNYRYHEKALVVDYHSDRVSRAAIIGGINSRNQYFGIGTEKWTDADLLLKGGIVATLGESFLEDWESYRSQHEDEWSCLNPYPVGTPQFEEFLSAHTRPYLEPSTAADRENYAVAAAELARLQQPSARSWPVLRGARGVFIKNDPRRGERLHDNRIEQSYLTMIRQAKHEILIANLYFIISRPVLKALRAASMRGVAIKVVSNSARTNPQKGAVRLSRATYEALVDPYHRHGRLKGPWKRLSAPSYRAERKAWQAVPQQQRGDIAIFEYEGAPSPTTDLVLPPDMLMAKGLLREKPSSPGQARPLPFPQVIWPEFQEALRRRVYCATAGGSGTKLLHSKYAIIDRRFVTIGSFNLDPRSRNLSREHVVWMESPHLAHSVVESFFELVSFSRRLRREEMHRYRHPKGAAEALRLSANRVIKQQY